MGNIEFLNLQNGDSLRKKLLSIPERRDFMIIFSEPWASVIERRLRADLFDIRVRKNKARLQRFDFLDVKPIKES